MPFVHVPPPFASQSSVVLHDTKQRLRVRAAGNVPAGSVTVSLVFEGPDDEHAKRVTTASTEAARRRASMARV